MQFDAVRAWLFGCWLGVEPSGGRGGWGGWGCLPVSFPSVFTGLRGDSCLLKAFDVGRFCSCSHLPLSPSSFFSVLFTSFFFFLLLLKSHQVFLLYGLLTLECLFTLQAHDIYWVECKLSATFEMNPSLLWVFNEIASWVTASVFTHYQKSPQRG